MKHTPIYIVNRDRLGPTKDLIDSLLNRNYWNITVIDNDSTFIPLFDFYEQYNKEINLVVAPPGVPKTNDVLRQMVDRKIEPYHTICNTQWFVFSDSDVVPVEEVPQNFIEDFFEFAQITGGSKIGPMYKTDDIPDHYPLKSTVVPYESGLVSHPVPYKEANGIKLYCSPIDTTFALHRPGTRCDWRAGGIALRAREPYVFRHMPWYYDPENLPDDENHYMKNFNPKFAFGWSAKIKDKVKLR